jgi:PGF-CTERM motif
MVKKLILGTMVLMLAISSFAAGQQGMHEPGTGLTSPETKEAAQGAGQGLQTTNVTNVSTANPGVHEPGTGITNPEVKEAAQGTGQGSQAQAGQPAKEPATPVQSQKTQPGFEVIFALTGIIVAASILLRRRN